MRKLTAFIGACLRVVSGALRSYFGARAPEAAGSIGFYAVFSLFPLLLILIAVGGSLLARFFSQEQILNAIVNQLPVSRGFVGGQMSAVLAAGGAVTVVGAVGLVWSATSVFAILVRNLNRAWPGAVPSNVFKARLIALALLAGLVGLALLFLALKALPAAESDLAWVSQFTVRLSDLVRATSRFVLVGFIFGALTLLYRWVPSTSVRWVEAAFGALVATAAFVGVTSAFTWYLESGYARYSLVYGPLGALLALLTWIYVVGAVVLFGAHLGSALAGVTRGGGTAGGET
jgi:membrane protein